MLCACELEACHSLIRQAFERAPFSLSRSSLLQLALLFSSAPYKRPTCEDSPSYIHIFNLGSMKIIVPLLVCAAALAVASPAQVPLQMNNENGGTISASKRLDLCLSAVTLIVLSQKEPKKLHGRFLHITDMHPDPYYTPRASTSKSCHGKKAKKKSKRAGFWGTPVVFVIPYS